MTRTIHILNGPNLNLLGTRQPEIYGHETLADVETACTAVGREVGLAVRLLQSNWEGQIVDWIHAARDQAAGIIINPGALSHTSVAILDALMAFEGPVLEVHISNIHRRESFRHHSYVSRRADGVIAGFGVEGYAQAMRRMGTLLAAGRRASAPPRPPPQSWRRSRSRSIRSASAPPSGRNREPAKTQPAVKKPAVTGGRSYWALK
jgi:3-dehydroquinate dehydratase-2